MLKHREKNKNEIKLWELKLFLKVTAPFFVISITYSPIIYYLYVCITDDKEAKKEETKARNTTLSMLTTILH